MICNKCKSELVEVIINKLFICQSCGNKKEVVNNE